MAKLVAKIAPSTGALKMGATVWSPTSGSQLQVARGERILLRLELQNQSLTPICYTIEILGLSPDWYSPSAPITIGPFGSAEIFFQLEIPQDPKAGVVHFKVTAKSEGEGDQGFKPLNLSFEVLVKDQPSCPPPQPPSPASQPQWHANYSAQSEPATAAKVEVRRRAAPMPSMPEACLAAEPSQSEHAPVLEAEAAEESRALSADQTIKDPGDGENLYARAGETLLIEFQVANPTSSVRAFSLNNDARSELQGLRPVRDRIMLAPGTSGKLSATVRIPKGADPSLEKLKLQIVETLSGEAESQAKEVTLNLITQPSLQAIAASEPQQNTGISGFIESIRRRRAERQAKSTQAPVVQQATAAGGDGDLVHCSVMAPPKVRAASQFMVQAFLHIPALAGEVKSASLKADPSSSQLGSSALSLRVREGDTLSLELSLPGAEVEDACQQILWSGTSSSVQFMAKVARRESGEPLFGKLVVVNSGIPVGRVSFRIELTSAGKTAPALPTGSARRYERAFISYASADRSEVLRRVQVLPRLGIDYFQDIMSLEPGDHWAQEIYRHIDECDVLLLFWSQAAKKSEWVEKEWKYALKVKDGDCIQPVVIEGPPLVQPPPELSHLHFNDRFLHVIAASGPA